MSMPAAATDTLIRAQAKELRLSAVAARFADLAEQAASEGQPHRDYLATLFELELDQRAQHRAERRLKEAHFPHRKRLEDFNFEQAPAISATQLHQLAKGEYLTRAQNVIFIGDSGTGKTHLATGLGIAACYQGRRVRYATTAALVTELQEAQESGQLTRIVRRYAGIELLVLDELGYVQASQSGAELLFQVLAERNESASIVLTTNLPFGEWTRVFTDARLCKAVVDRLTFGAHIIETGSESWRLRRSLDRTRSASALAAQGAAKAPAAKRGRR
jgi:DNA replication protein DnaC